MTAYGGAVSARARSVLLVGYFIEAKAPGSYKIDYEPSLQGALLAVDGRHR
jgi:hypothetical protein